MVGQQSNKCQEAMQSKLTWLNEKQTRELASVHERAKPLKSKSGSNVKLNPDGSIESKKARLVNKVYEQRPGMSNI